MSPAENSSQENSPTIFVSAGDPSGDIAGNHLLRGLREIESRCRFFGLGGKQMRRLGQEQIAESERLAVLGFWEVAKKTLYFRGLLSDAERLIQERRPSVIILIDYPGFNLRLAERIKPLGIPIVYYISPQIWAWGGKRINLIKRLVDRMLVILPFEKELYDKAGVKCDFVGHYLLDDMDSRFVKAPYNPASDLIALLPGSRPQEIEKMLPVLIETAAMMSREKQYRFAVAGVEGRFDYEAYLRKSQVKIELGMGKMRELVTQSCLVITSSGTATLETGIIGRPMIVIYKTGRLTYLIARRLVKLDRIALMNITAGKMLAPELIQGDATASNIAAEARGILSNQELALDIISHMHRVTDSLGTPGVGRRAAGIIREYLPC